MIRNLTELKHRLRDHLICSSSCMEELPIDGNLIYNWPLKL